METEGCSSIDRLCLFVFFVEQGEFWRRSSCRYVVISFFISNRLGIESSDSLPLTPTDQLDCFQFFFSSLPKWSDPFSLRSGTTASEREREREKKSKKRNENRRVETTSSSAGDRWPWLLGSSRTRATSSDLGMTPISHSSIAGTLRNPSRLPLLVPPLSLSLSLSLFFFFLCLSGSPIFLLFFYPPRKQGTTVHPTARVLRFGAKCVSVSVCV